MKLCFGNCGKEAKFGNWCSERYNDCSGYKKRLSDKAKLRGNNGARGRLSKKYWISDPCGKQEFDLICSICGYKYKKILLRGTALKPDYTPVCNECLKIKHSNSLKRSHIEKARSIKYEDVSGGLRKRICWEEQGEKCNHCGFNKYPLIGGPYELHHIDGNRENNLRENEEVLCRNCHFMTDNFSMKNKHHSKSTWLIINKNNQKKCRKEGY